LGIFCCVLALALLPRSSRIVGVIALVALAEVGLIVAARTGTLPDGPLEALLGADVKSEKALAGGGTTTHDVVDSVWSPLGRLDVHRAPKDRDRTLGVFTDGMSPTYMVQEDDARAATFEATWGLLMSLPYRALEPKRVLVLGAGAGASVWLAKKYGATRIDAVEVSPAMPDLLARWKHFAGDVYGQPGVRLYTEDARRFLTDTSERYDLIELALALTGNVHAQPSGLEAHLYTVEAVQLYLRRLSPTGSLVQIHSDPGNAYRQLLTVLEALASMGVPRANALDGIVVLHDPRRNIAYRYMLVVRTSPMVLDIVDGRDAPPAELLWGPGDPPERSAQLLDRKRLGATAADDLSPVHDDRPYFFQNTRGFVATALADSGRVWVLMGALVLLFALIVERRRHDTAAFTRPALAAGALGAAFLCVELALIQRFTLAAGGTLYAVSFVLFALLAWSAAGALIVAGRWRQRRRGVAWAALAAAFAVVVTAFVVRDLAWLDALSSEGTRLALIAALLAPAGLSLGCPFPVLLSHHGDPAERIGSLWAINGAASVAGGVIAVLTLRVAGSFDALLVGAVLYVAAASLAPRADHSA
jgi:SAM-dependent methyltransferase